MKNLALALAISALLVSGCSSSPKSAQPAAAQAAKPADAAVKERSPEEVQLLIDQARALAGLPPENKDPDVAEVREEWVVMDDPVSGQKVQRIPKNEILSVVDGKLRHALLNPKMFSLPLVREDEGYYYVKAPATQAAKPKKGEAGEAPPETLMPIQDVPASEYAVVTPGPSATRLRFEEKSEGLPKGGYWRTNIAVADLDGDGSPEIVTPPPRLAATAFHVFRYEGGTWKDVPLSIEAEPGVGLAYGGVAVGDLDRDGRPDIVTIGHGAGPAIAFNRGGFRFELVSRGLPKEMSSRAVALGDLNRDGLLDILAISDEPVASEAYRAQRKKAAKTHSRDGKVTVEEPVVEKKVFDVRAFFAKPDGTFSESNGGLETACFANTLALATPPADQGNPYFVSGCRYGAGRGILFEWDEAAKTFRSFGRNVAEGSSVHTGAATGTYRGKPAAFAGYIKGNAPGAPADKPTRGYGISVFYRDGSAWTSKRIVKVLTNQVDESQALGVGDLNGDGLDDIAWADDVAGRVRVFFQTPAGEFEELDPALQPRYPNHSMSLQIVDVDRDGKKDIVLMFEFRSSDRSRAGGLKFFRNLG